MRQTFYANYKKVDGWYIGWVDEVPGVNTQGKTLKEVKVNLHEALSLVVETNRIMMNKELTGGRVIRETIALQA